MPSSNEKNRISWLRDLPAVREHERRATVRFSPEILRCTLSGNTGTPVSTSATIVDVSASGALLESPIRFAVNAEVTCRFTPPRHEEFDLKAVVVRVIEPTATSRHVRLGIRFLIRAGKDSQLMKWIFSEMARKKRGAI